MNRRAYWLLRAIQIKRVKSGNVIELQGLSYVVKNFNGGHLKAQHVQLFVRVRTNPLHQSPFLKQLELLISKWRQSSHHGTARVW